MTRQSEIKIAAGREMHLDGLTEIMAGVMLFIVALSTGRPAFYWTYLIVLFLLGPGLQRLKARITYPRIGYVKIPDEDPSRLRKGVLTWVLAVFFIAAIVLTVSGHVHDNLSWRRIAPALGGFLFAGGFLYLARQSRLRRHWILAGLSVITGIVMVLPNTNQPYGNLRTWALTMALICLTFGGVVLQNFLRSTPLREHRMPDES